MRPAEDDPVALAYALAINIIGIVVAVLVEWFVLRLNSPREAKMLLAHERDLGRGGPYR